MNIIARLVDLRPIAESHYYHPSQEGSWSIKAVLPAVASDLDYAKLDGVQDGGMAMAAYCRGNPPPRLRRAPQRHKAGASRILQTRHLRDGAPVAAFCRPQPISGFDPMPKRPDNLEPSNWPWRSFAESRASARLRRRNSTHSCRTRGLQRDLRTIQRQLEALSAHFDIEHDDRSRPYGCRWKEQAAGFSLPSLGPRSH